MTKIPETVKNDVLVPYLVERGCLLHQGKVRESYRFPDSGNIRLVVASDRLSIFDIVLNITVPRKGEVLTALTHLWLTGPLSVIPSHLVAAVDRDYYHYSLAEPLKLALPDVDMSRTLIVQEAVIPPYEMIFRRHIGGSVFQKYQETGMAGGHSLTPGLAKWSRLDRPLFTPSTKAESGHDKNISANEYFAAMGQDGYNCASMFEKAYSIAYEYAEARGILILDTKFEGLTMLADEVLTPDSSRFTTVEDWELAMKEGRDPIFYDKEPVREWGRTVQTPFVNRNGKSIIGLHKLDPEDPAHLEFAHSVAVPPEVVQQTTARYLDIFEKLAGESLEDYQQKYLI